MSQEQATELCVVYVTVPDLTAAQQISRALVAEKLAACVSQLGPLHSTYAWQGQIESAEEVLLIIKTRQTCLQALQARVKQLHSYEVPELIALPIVGGLPDYLKWIHTETKEPNHEQ